MNSLIGPKRHYYIFSSGNIVNEFNNWIEKHPRVIQYLNVSDSRFVKLNGTMVNKHKHLIKISVRDLQNDIILPVSQGFFVKEMKTAKYLLEISIL